MTKFYISKEELENLYYDKGLNYPDIEKMFGLSKGTMYYWAKKYNIKARHSFHIPRTKEWKEKIAKSNSKPLSEERKLKISIAHKGKKLSQETKDKLSKWLTGKRVGPKHPMYIDGRSSIKKRLRALGKSTQWRKSIFKRDNYTCQMCGKKGSVLNAHHIVPIKYLISEYNLITFDDYKNCNMIWNVNNGITLCVKCHRSIKNKELEYKDYFMEKINEQKKI